MTAKHPIPDSALDDRLGFVGTAGSGKTYCAGTCVERLLDKGARVVVVDPLGVWFGLRLIADGSSSSRYSMPIFGGAHGDLPLSEHAGALIGETVAGMTESCIISLDGLQTKSAERRFMLAFLDAIYRKANGEPVHIVFDEADLWAPQKTTEPMLQSRMEEICRRGRVKGLIPWLITQRPAVISKDVLSQVDGLVAFKLTSSQDRDALEGWIEGQADRALWKEIRAALPTMERGEGVVWIPGRDVLETAKFPTKRTFDSSRTPKRGEAKRKTELKPLDLTALKGKLATIEAEKKADDPKALRARIAELERNLKAAQTSTLAHSPDPKAIAEAERRGYQRGEVETAPVWFRRGVEAATSGIVTAAKQLDRAEFVNKELETWRGIGALPASAKSASPPPPNVRPGNAERKAIPPRAMPNAGASGNGTLSLSFQKVLDAIAWWAKIGVEPVERARASVVAGYSPKASTFGVYVAELVKLGLVEVTPGRVALTPAGFGQANVPAAATAAELRDMARALLSPQEARVFDVVYDRYPKEIRRSEIAEAVGLSPQASTCGVYLAGVSAYGIIETAGRGAVRASDWLFP